MDKKTAKKAAVRKLSEAHAIHSMAVAVAQDIRDCVYNCIRKIAPGANIRDSSILSRIPIPNFTALGKCINGCVPLSGANSWGGGVAIDPSWTVEDLIDETTTLKNNA